MVRRRILLLAISCFVVVFGTARAQEHACEKEPAGTCNHGGCDLWDAIRIRPVRFTEFNGKTAQWKYRDEYTLKLGSFVLLEHSQYVSREKQRVSVSYLTKHADSDWLCYYCYRCNALLKAYELKPGTLPSD